MISVNERLGGGSSNAAFLLKGLNENFGLGLTPDQLRRYAYRLGADCSFFIGDRPAFATGIGEKLHAIDLSLNGYFLVLVKPPVGVGTKAAYAGIKPGTPKRSLTDIIHLSPQKWQEHLVNDFEVSVFPLFPEIGEIKSKLLSHGAIYAAMSGSGSSVFGLFKDEPKLELADFPPDFFVWKEWI